MKDIKVLNNMLSMFESIYSSSNINEVDFSGIDYYVNLIISRNMSKDPHTNLFNGFVRNFERQSSFFVDECYKERREARNVIKKNLFFRGDKLGLYFAIYLYINGLISDYKFAKNFKRLYESIYKDDLYNFEIIEFDKILKKTQNYNLYDYLFKKDNREFSVKDLDKSFKILLDNLN